MCTFKCGNHNFETDSFEEWTKHEETQEHTITGNGECNQCGTKTSFSHTGKKIKGALPILCQDCRKLITDTINSLSSTGTP